MERQRSFRVGKQLIDKEKRFRLVVRPQKHVWRRVEQLVPQDAGSMMSNMDVRLSSRAQPACRLLRLLDFFFPAAHAPRSVMPRREPMECF